MAKGTGRYDEAVARYREALALVAPDSDAAATLWHNLGGIEHARGRYAHADGPACRTVGIRSRLVPYDDLALVRDRAALAGVLVGLGQLADAELLLDDALVVFERAAEELDVAVTLANLAAIAHHRGDLKEAERGYRRALELKEHTLGAEHPDVAITRDNLAVVLAVSRPARTARR